MKYADALAANEKAWGEFVTRFRPAPYFPNVSMGWDASPRCLQTDRYEFRGYPWMNSFTDNTPGAFRAALMKAKGHLERSSTQPKFITINAWNEWTEGSYLLPDTVHGTQYLKAIKAVFGENR